MTVSPLHHVGIVVADLETAKRRFSELLGLTWGPTLQTDALEVRDGAGSDLVVPSRVAFSVEAPHLELIEEQAGTIWVRDGSSSLHHIAFTTPDLPATSTRIASSRCPLQLCGRRDDVVPATFAYHADDLDVRIELLESGLPIDPVVAE